MSNTKATGVAYLDPEFSTCFVTEQLGYSLVAQGTATQATSKSTGVTINKSSGQITMNNAALAASTNVSFVLTNSLLSVNDVVLLNVASGAATPGTYNVFVGTVSAGSVTIVLRNISAGSLSEAVVINYCVIHGS